MMVTANGGCHKNQSGRYFKTGYRPATGVKAQNLTGNDVVMSVNKIINPEDDPKLDIKRLDEGSSSDEPEIIAEQTSLLDNEEV